MLTNIVRKCCYSRLYPRCRSTEIYVHTDEAGASFISQDDLVANFRTIGKLDPTVNKEDIAAALTLPTLINSQIFRNL